MILRIFSSQVKDLTKNSETFRKVNGSWSDLLCKSLDFQQATNCTFSLYARRHVRHT